MKIKYIRNFSNQEVKCDLSEYVESMLSIDDGGKIESIEASLRSITKSYARLIEVLAEKNIINLSEVEVIVHGHKLQSSRELEVVK
jgi:hypothetical protein